MLAFPIQQVRVAGKLRTFALGEINIDPKHLYPSLRGCRGLPLLVFVVPNLRHTILNEAIGRGVLADDVTLRKMRISVTDGGAKALVTTADLTYELVDEAGHISIPMSGSVHFSNDIVGKFVERFQSVAYSEASLIQVCGIIGLAHLEAHGLEKPKLEQKKNRAVILQRANRGPSL